MINDVAMLHGVPREGPGDSGPWRATRIVHLFGGARATNPRGPSVHLSTVGPSEFRLSGYGQLFAALEDQKLSIVGADFYSRRDELDGFLPPPWRVYAARSGSPWIVEESARTWANIRTGGLHAKVFDLADTSARISQALRATSWRLRDLSESYRAALSAVVHRGDYKVGQRYQDEFIWLIYSALEAVLFNACILRDRLSSFAGRHVLADQLGLANKTDRASTLAKALRGCNVKGDPLLDALKAGTRPSGWMHKLGLYRDLIVHEVPLVQAANELFARKGEIQSKKGALPIIRCPLPADPQLTLDSRTDGTGYARQIFEDIDKSSPTVDGLEYAHDVTVRLAELADAISLRSPVRPKQLQIVPLPGSVRRSHGRIDLTLAVPAVPPGEPKRGALPDD